jgi:rod shape-determining protein MreD
MGLLCGLILDLLSSHTRLGIHALNFCITLLVIYPQKRNFFADSLTTLPIMTFLFASLSTLIMVFLVYGLEMNDVLSWHWVITDLLIMPAADAAYAFCCFILPGLIFGKPRRRGKDYFFQ